MKSNHGTIDHGIFFDMNVALSISSELKVGCRVEYLAYKHSATDHIKVVKIEQIMDQYWDDKQPTEQKVDNPFSPYCLVSFTIFNFYFRLKNK